MAANPPVDQAPATCEICREPMQADHECPHPSTLSLQELFMQAGRALARKERLAKITALLAVVATFAATPVRADILTDPAVVCAAAKAGNGAWLDLAGLKRCIASEKLRAIDQREIESLRDALKVRSEALQAAQAQVLEAGRWRWYYAGGGAAVGLLVTVLIVGAVR